MTEFARIHGKGRTLNVEEGDRDMQFPDTPDMPEEYKGRIVHVTFGYSKTGMVIYRTDTGEDLVGVAREYFLAENRRNPFG